MSLAKGAAIFVYTLLGTESSLLPKGREDMQRAMWVLGIVLGVARQCSKPVRNAGLAPPLQDVDTEAWQDLGICADPAECGVTKTRLSGLSSPGACSSSCCTQRACSKALWTVSSPSHYLPPLIAGVTSPWGVTVSAARAFTRETRADPGSDQDVPSNLLTGQLMERKRCRSKRPAPGWEGPGPRNADPASWG